MKPTAELYSGTYQYYAADVYQRIRQDTYGEEIGQNSWLTVDEYRRIFQLLQLGPGKKVLEIATGSGGPALYMAKQTGCHLTGIDINENGIQNAQKLAEENGLAGRMEFLLANASQPLPFASDSFDAIISMDSMNHINHRGQVLKEFYRVLKPGGQLLYTDPTVVTGFVTHEELAIRSSIGFFLFGPLGENERLLKEAGFKPYRQPM